jgi:hypothetical protein
MCYRSEDNNLMKYKTALVKRAIAEMKCNDDGVDTDPIFQFFLLIFVKLLMVLEKINEDEKSVELVLCDGSEFVDQRVILNSRLQYSTHSNVEMR